MKNMLMIAALMMVSSGVYADQLCKKVNLDLTNGVGEGIKVYKIEYYDLEDAKWRSNSIKNTTIPLNGSKRVVESLEYVGNEAVGSFRVQYKRLAGGGKVWSKNLPSGLSNCKKNSVIAFNIKPR
jgi:hypothetical protein